MGFFAGRFDLLISRLELYVAFLLAFMSNGIWCVIGRLAEILEPETLSDNPRSPISVESIKEYLPVATFAEILQRFGEVDEDFVCTVCLSSFEEQEEIRELCNCRHIFHRHCLDEWVDHGQSRCPTCRSCLVPDQEAEEEGESASVVERIAFLFAQDIISLPY